MARSYRVRVASQRTLSAIAGIFLNFAIPSLRWFGYTGTIQPNAASRICGSNIVGFVMKRLKYLYALLAGSLLLSSSLSAQNVIISEFMASNSRTLADEDGDFSDW